jgi:formylglycine-generating enzyme required for sulfatase activity
MRGMTLPVGSFLPNAWGLYDMSGNVNEWVIDWYDDYPNRPETNPLGPSDDNPRSVNKVYRGGSWDIPAMFLRSSSRMGTSPDRKGNSLGFRLVKKYN